MIYFIFSSSTGAKSLILASSKFNTRHENEGLLITSKKCLNMGSEVQFFFGELVYAACITSVTYENIDADLERINRVNIIFI